MSKEVILMEDVPGLGNVGEVVRVADGYARNYLFPRNLAAVVTEATRRQIEKRRAEVEARRAKLREAAELIAKQVNACDCTIAVKTGGPEDRMYGSVTVLDILAELKKQAITLEKSQLELREAIRELGEYTIPVKLSHDVKAELKVKIVKQG